MRKEFREPELKRIELRLEERIATSYSTTIEDVLILRHAMLPEGNCRETIQTTDLEYPSDFIYSNLDEIAVGGCIVWGVEPSSLGEYVRTR